MMRYALPLLVAFALLGPSAPASAMPPPLPDQLTPKTRNAALDTIKTQFRESYVFPEMRPKIIERLDRGQKSGRYDVDDPFLFAERITEDLRDAKADRLVILLTDGDETCGGDPAAAIEKLVKAGVRVNIVGFAIDDAKLAATLRHWSDVAGGMYFEAQDARGLDAAMTQATKSSRPNPWRGS